MGRAKATKKMGTSIVEKLEKNKRRRRSRTPRPRHPKPSCRSEVVVEVDEGRKWLMEKIWTQKYNMPLTIEGILRLEETPKGSTIWELASQNRNIINNYAFWEIRGGSITRFSEEEWQHRDRMVSIQSLQSTHQKAVREGLEYVREYCKEGEPDETWRTWRKPEECDENIDQEQKGIFIKELESRKIKIRSGPDILRWGKSTRGTFTVKEAYYLTTR